MNKLEKPFPDRKITGEDFNKVVDHINEALEKIDAFNKKHSEFEAKLDNFYSKQIELFGIFIAIFSFIIAGIQITSKSNGTFLENLSTNTAVFIPITFAIAILFYLIKRILNK
jgi:hypothetical protein